MNNKFNVKGFVSLFLLFSFLALLVSGTALFIMPHGRIAYWLNWQLAGINKTGWENLHVSFAVLFMLAGLVHLFMYNWNILKRYIKPRTMPRAKVSVELAAVVILCMGAGAVALFNVPPVSTFMGAGEKIKGSWVTKENKPPFPHAELMSVNELCEKEDIDPAQAMGNMKKAGIPVKSVNQRIAFIARDTGTSARDIFLVIKGE